MCVWQGVSTYHILLKQNGESVCLCGVTSFHFGPRKIDKMSIFIGTFSLLSKRSKASLLATYRLDDFDAHGVNERLRKAVESVADGDVFEQCWMDGFILFLFFSFTNIHISKYI